MNIGQYVGMGSAPLQLPATSTIDESTYYLFYYHTTKHYYGLMKYGDFDRNRDIIPLVVNNGTKTKQ